MTTFAIITAALSALLVIHYLDHRYGWQLNAWLNGKSVNPFTPTRAHTREQDAETIAALKERIQTLETIVTEPAYELNRKINALK